MCAIEDDQNDCTYRTVDASPKWVRVPRGERQQLHKPSVSPYRVGRMVGMDVLIPEVLRGIRRRQTKKAA